MRQGGTFKFYNKIGWILSNGDRQVVVSQFICRNSNKGGRWELISTSSHFMVPESLTWKLRQISFVVFAGLFAGNLSQCLRNITTSSFDQDLISMGYLFRHLIITPVIVAFIKTVVSRNGFTVLIDRESEVIFEFNIIPYYNHYSYSNFSTHKVSHPGFSFWSISVVIIPLFWVFKLHQKGRKQNYHSGHHSLKQAPSIYKSFTGLCKFWYLNFNAKPGSNCNKAQCNKYRITSGIPGFPAAMDNPRLESIAPGLG